MPLNKKNQRGFHRTLYAGQLQKITLLKRGDDLQQGTVTAHVLFNCRRRMISKTGQTIAGDISSAHSVTWVIPRQELDRVGVNYLNATDRIVDPVEGGTWQPESTTGLLIKLFGNIVNVDCLRTDAA